MYIADSYTNLINHFSFFGYLQLFGPCCLNSRLVTEWSSGLEWI